MIDEIKKPVDPEINGSARKAELQSIKQSFGKNLGITI